MDPSYFTPRAARISNWLELANEFRKTLGTPAPDAGGAHEDVLEERVFDADPAPASIAAGSEEEAALLARVDALLRPALRAMPDAFRLMCLRGRKYRVERAAAAVRQLTELLSVLDPAAAPDPARAEAQLLEQMRAGKIEISGGADDDGRAILTVRLRANDPTRSAPADYARLLVYSVLWALRDNPEAQRQGVVFFVDATDVSLRNSDPPTSKLTKWVAGQLPVRVAQIVVYNAPFAFGSVMAPLALAAMPALRRRVKLVNSAEHAALHAAVQPSALTAEYGGKLDFDREAWAIAALQYGRSQSRAAVAACFGLTDL